MVKIEKNSLVKYQKRQFLFLKLFNNLKDHK